MTLTPVIGRRGRPRDERIDNDILSAALDELAENGFARFSVEAVAMRAGVAKTSIYRRFPTRDDLVAGALNRLNDDLPLNVPTGSVRRQLIMVLGGIRRRSPESQRGRILRHASAESGRDPALAELVHHRVLAPRRMVLRRIIESGIASGELKADIDLDAVIPVLVGPMLYLGMWHTTEAMRSVTVESVVDLVLSGLTRASDS